MDKKIEKAVDYYSKNFNCAQSVFAAFSEKYGLDEKTALKTASGFGAGLRNGEVCGAVAGAVMAIGLRYGQYDSEDAEAKKICYQKTEEFADKFREENGAVSCRELLGHDVRTERELIMQKNLFKTKCAGFVKAAADLLIRLGY